MSDDAPVPSYRSDPRPCCPRCDGHLEKGAQGDLAFDVCERCGGVFVPPATMNAVAASEDTPTDLRAAIPDKPLQREQEVRYLMCPQCAKSMNRGVFARVSGIIVDVCREHGVWFDAGELAAAIEFVEQGGLHRAKTRAEADREEARKAAHSARTMAQAPLPQRSGIPEHTVGVNDVVDLVRSLMHELFGD